MKTLTMKAPGLGSALVLLFGITSSALAGPGPQYWQQQEKIRAENAAPAKATAAAANPADASAMACASCKTTKIEEFAATNVSGKYAPHTMTIGSKHECSACGGAVATVHGKTTNDMKANCPLCAKAKAASTTCCKAAG